MQETPQCPSCGFARTGPYCSQCGERYLGAHDFQLRHFLSHLAAEFFELDGKLPRTLRVLLLRPGQLAVDYVEGRRTAFVSPLRLFLVMFVAFIFLNTALTRHAPSLPERVSAFDPTGLLTRLIDTRQGVDWTDPEIRTRLAERAHWLAETATLLVFLGVAAVQSTVFYRLRRRYLENVMLALNVSAFYLFVLLAGFLPLAFVPPEHFEAWSSNVQQAASLLALPLYWCLAIRRFYRLSWIASIGGMLAVTLGNYLMAIALNTMFLALLILMA